MADCFKAIAQMNIDLYIKNSMYVCYAVKLLRTMHQVYNHFQNKYQCTFNGGVHIDQICVTNQNC